MINYAQIAPGFEMSKYQKDFLEAVVNTKSNIVLEASAGSGKTTTSLLALKVIPKFRKTIFLSFSNAIVNELKEKVPPHVRASTLHSLGMRFLTGYYPGIRMNPNKYMQLALDDYGAKKKDTFRKAFKIQEISNFVRMTLAKLDVDYIYEMCDRFNVDCDEETIEKTIKLIRNDDYPRSIDFADMIFLPAIKEDIIQEQFHFVILDEMQDCNNAQIQFCQNLLKPDGGRLISVGDPNQAIYGFSGSDINCFKKMQSIDNTLSLPLSICYRCGSDIVDEAKQIYDNIEANPKGHKGLVRQGDFLEIESGDMVVSRNNAPLVDLYFRLIDNGIKCKILGKDIEKGIIEIAEECMAPIKDRFEQNLNEKLDTLVSELTSKGISNPAQHQRYQNLCDKLDLLEIINNKVKSTSEIIPTIESIFVEDEIEEGAKLMTIHRSKGMESDRVFYMKNYKGKLLIPSKFATQKWQLVQEKNLDFVATTRAKKELVYFDLY